MLWTNWCDYYDDNMPIWCNLDELIWDLPDDYDFEDDEYWDTTWE